VLPDPDEEAFRDSGRLVKRNMFSQEKVNLEEHTRKDELV
jgi:hypothetical protein